MDAAGAVRFNSTVSLRSHHALVAIDLGRIRANAAAIRGRTGVPVWAVVKADAYGLGIGPVARALAGVVDGFCVFDLAEAVEADLWRTTGKPAIAIGPPSSFDPAPYLEHHVRPAVHTVEQAKGLSRARPILCVDTGMQRFACPPEQADEVLRAGEIDEAFTHAATAQQAHRLVERLGGRGLRLHAAASSLLDDPACRLDAVRPGLALYHGAVRVSVPLFEVRQTRGPAGYTAFAAPRHGVIPVGYAHGLRPGPCLVNGRPSRIIETGMQSAYVQTEAGDRSGDPVVLLGDVPAPEQIAASWGTSPHEALLRLAGVGRRQYRGVQARV